MSFGGYLNTSNRTSPDERTFPEPGSFGNPGKVGTIGATSDGCYVAEDVSQFLPSDDPCLSFSEKGPKPPMKGQPVAQPRPKSGPRMGNTKPRSTSQSSNQGGRDSWTHVGTQRPPSIPAGRAQEFSVYGQQGRSSEAATNIKRSKSPRNAGEGQASERRPSPGAASGAFSGLLRSPKARTVLAEGLHAKGISSQTAHFMPMVSPRTYLMTLLFRPSGETIEANGQTQVLPAAKNRQAK